MTKPETSKLHVRLSASQARRRLKGRGFGVKRVEATGYHHSVIVHTATGGHLRDLESLFSDVMRPAAQRESGAKPDSYGRQDVSEAAPDC